MEVEERGPKVFSLAAERMEMPASEMGKSVVKLIFRCRNIVTSVRTTCV